MQIPRLSARKASIAAMVVLAIGSPVRAATLVHSVFQEHIFATGLFHKYSTSDDLPESFADAGTIPGVTGSASVRTLGGALPLAEGRISYTATANPTTSLFGSFEARIYYEWTVERVGGDPFAGTVPIVVRTRGAIERVSNTYGKVQHLWARAKIVLPDTGRASDSHVAPGCTSFVCGPEHASFDDTFRGAATPGASYSVTLDAKGQGYLGADGGSFSIGAWVDPRIEIAPDFDRRDDFRLVFSEGVTPVPEPASAALLAAGLAVLLVSGRRVRSGCTGV